jgi:hypothetical protein
VARGIAAGRAAERVARGVQRIGDRALQGGVRHQHAAGHQPLPQPRFHLRLWLCVHRSLHGGGAHLLLGRRHALEPAAVRDQLHTRYPGVPSGPMAGARAADLDHASVDGLHVAGHPHPGGVRRHLDHVRTATTPGRT